MNHANGFMFVEVLVTLMLLAGLSVGLISQLHAIHGVFYQTLTKTNKWQMLEYCREYQRPC